MTMQGPGRRSRFSHYQNENLFNYNVNEVSLVAKECLILDICSNYNHETKFLSDYKDNKKSWKSILEKFKNGIYFIVFCFVNNEEYYIRVKDYDNLRMLYGTDENIIGRKVLIHSRTFLQSEIENSDYTFMPNRNYQDESASIYISAGGIGGLTTDMRSQNKAFLGNENDGNGPSWKNHLE